jgi:purine-binding chemotaxis protein CheW
MEKITDKSNHYLIFILEKERYALSVSSVERIFQAVNITHLPEGPDILKGIIKMKGLIVPVINIRKRLNLPDKELELSDTMIIARTEKLIVALLVDEVTGLMEIEEKDMEQKDNILPGLKYIEGVIKFSSDIIIVCNLDDFLSLEEEEIIADITGEKKDNEY